MSRKHLEVAIAYDFDGTLAPGNMQEYDFIPRLHMKPKDFWAEANQLAKDCDGDPILAYLNLMLRKAQSADVPIRKEDFVNYGRSVTLFDGVEDWFERINVYGRERGITVKHYIVSSGIREMIEGSPIAKRFERVFASAFAYNASGVAYAPALAINYTTKTQFLFRINKGTLAAWDNTVINAYVDKEKRPVPFERMIYLGDGETDVPCMRLVKDQGGHAIAVYKGHKRGGKNIAQRLLDEGRVNFIASADYSADKDIDSQVKAVLDRIAADIRLDQLGRR
jgi:hypothetical protein